MGRIESEIRLNFGDVMIRPKRSTLKSRSDVVLARTMTMKHSGQVLSCVPLTVSNMDSTGTFEMAAEAGRFQVLTCMHKFYTVAQWEAFAKASPEALPFVAASAGISESDLATLAAILAAVPAVQMICLDVANGYSEHFVKAVAKVRAAHPGKTLIAGNVVTAEMTEALVLAGADAVKIGIGPGSVCTTRTRTGVGYPQLSAVIECADAAHGLNAHIVSDGGCACPGDVAKAFGAGADFVMAGGIFAGHDESGGELIKVDGVKLKEFYGMSSTKAMEKHSGTVAEYRASEGKSVQIPYRGPVKATLKEYLGGLRSACTYVGAAHLKELPKRTTFIRCTQILNPVFANVKHTNTIPVSYLNDGTGEPAAKKAKK